MKNLIYISYFMKISCSKITLENDKCMPHQKFKIQLVFGPS